MDASPYVFDKGPGLVHIRTKDGQCIGDCRTDVFEIVWAEAKREGHREALEAAQRLAKGEGGRP